MSGPPSQDAPLSGGSFGGVDDLAPSAEPAAALDAPLHARLEPGGVLGRGGMGEVRSAWDPTLCRRVALKTMAAGASEARFLTEAALTSRLAHPAIVPVYGVGRHPDGRPFYTMRLVEGRSLRQHLSEGGQGDVGALLRRILVVVEAVALAHSQGIVHRDIKPDNLLLGQFGETWLVDWGLAAEVGAPGAPGIGTRGYLSPEQAEGAPADPSADVWSLGVVLREVTSGTSSSWSDPRALDAILSRCTAARPSDRYPHAGALSTDLRAWLDGRLVTAHRYTAPEVVAWALRRYWPVLLVSVAVGAVLAVVAMTGALRVSAERDRAVAAEELAVGERQAAVEHLARSLVDRARDAEREDRRAEASQLALASLRLAPSADARGVLAGVMGRVARRLSRVDLTCERPALSADGALLACADRTGLRVLAADGTELTRWSGQSWSHGFSDRRTLLFLGRNNLLWRWRPMDGDGGQAAVPEQVSASILPRHRRLVFGNADQVTIVGNGERYDLSLSGGEPVARGCRDGGPWLVAVDGEGHDALACSRGGVEISTPDGPQFWDVSGDRVTALAWSHGRLVAGTVDGDLRVWTPTGERAMPRRRGMRPPRWWRHQAGPCSPR